MSISNYAVMVFFKSIIMLTFRVLSILIYFVRVETAISAKGLVIS